MSLHKSALFIFLFFVFSLIPASAQLKPIIKNKGVARPLQWFPENEALISTGTRKEGSGMNFVSISDESPTPFQTPYLGQEPPGMEPKIFAPGWISTEGGFEFAGTFSPDFKEYFFTRRENGTIDNRIYHVKFEGSKFIGPVLAPFAYDCFEFEPHISPDGQSLYYGSRRPIAHNGDLARGTNIWIVKKNARGWSEPEYQGAPFDEAMFVCLADDGTMYNSGLTKSELVEGKYGPWEPLAPHLRGPFMHPCVGPHESFVIFDTDNDLGGHGKSLLISFYQSDGSWSEIISFRRLAQFSDFEKFGIPMLTPDHKYLFFTSEGDIYWVAAQVIEELRLK